MHHEPSGSCLALQPAADQRAKPSSPSTALLPFCQPDAAHPAGAAVLLPLAATGSRSCGRSPAAPKPATAHSSPSTRSKAVGTTQPERPECQCLACAQLQHHQANDTLLLLAIGTVVVVGGLVWLTGQIAGLLTSRTWPEVALADLPNILARLREHAGDPAAAWPVKVRDQLPGSVGMYATLAGILATPVVLGALAWWLHQPPAPPRPPATAAPRGRRALPPAIHPDLPMLSPPEHGEAP